jgi:DNA-binding LacI/PurR family transcriptional regulator
MRISLKSIADKAGVSVSTVSLALRKDPRIKKATREQIEKIAKELGYSPNPLLSSLASRQFRQNKNQAGLSLAYFTYLPEESRENKISYPYVTAYLNGIIPRAQELGYRVEHFELTQQKSLPALGRMLYQRGYAGIILGPVRDLAEPLDFPWEKFCVVACGGVEPQLASQFNWVRTDFFGVTRRAYLRAWEAGFRRIGVALATQTGNLEESSLRLGAILTLNRKLFDKSPIPVFEYIEADRRHHLNKVLTAFMKWYHKNKPDILIGYSLEFYYHLQKEGVRIPGDVAYISLHVNPDDKWYKDLSGYIINQMKLGRASVEQLDAQIHYGIRGPAADPHYVYILPDWVDGISKPVNTRT